MQTHGGADAEAAILAAERAFFVDLKVDWDRDGLYAHHLSDLSRYADDIQVDRSLAGSAPQEVMLIEGAAAAELSFTLGGEDADEADLNFVGVFSPYNGLSPLYNTDPIGCEVTYRIGVETATGIVWYSQFVGNIRLITPKRGEGSVEVKCLDRVEKLRTPVRFPVWGMSRYATQRGYEEAQLMDSAWVIDHCLRFGDTSSSPYRPLYAEEFTKTDPLYDTGMRFFLTGNGAYTPTVGMVDDNTTLGFPQSEGLGRPMYYDNGVPHPDSPEPSKPPQSLSSLGPDNTGWSAVGNGVSYLMGFWGLERDAPNINANHFVGFTLNNNGPDGSWWRAAGNTSQVIQVYVGIHMKLVLTLYQGSFRAEVRNWQTSAGVTTSWFAVPVQNHVQIDVRFAFGGGATGVADKVDVLFDGVNQGQETIADWDGIYDGNPDPYEGFVAVIHQAGVSDLYWSSRWSAGGFAIPADSALFNTHSRREAKYAAVLDRGMNRLTHLPASTSEDAWDVITKVAAAELGSVFWDENGVFKFWNRQTIIDLQEFDVRTLSLDEVEGLQITNSLDSVRNIVTSESIKGYSQKEVLYSSNAIDEFYVPGSSRVFFTLYLDDVQAIAPQVFTRYELADVTAFYPTWSPDDGSDSGFVVQWNFPGIGWEERSSRTGGTWAEIYSYFDKEGNTVVEIFNGGAEPMRLATGAAGASASAAFRILGSKVKRDETAILTATDLASMAKYGRRNLSITGEWVQWQPAVATSLLEFLLPRSVQPIPTTDAVVIAGDPRLQLGDTMSILDPDGLGEQMRVQTYGVTRHFSRDTGLTDTLTVEMLAPPRIGIWDSAQYGRWDETFIWS